MKYTLEMEGGLFRVRDPEGKRIRGLILCPDDTLETLRLPRDVEYKWIVVGTRKSKPMITRGWIKLEQWSSYRIQHKNRYIIATVKLADLVEKLFNWKPFWVRVDSYQRKRTV